MTWTNIKSFLNDAMSNYTAKQCKLLRRGKYSGGDHWRDGMLAMFYETLQELSEDDSWNPFTIAETRMLIYSFNRLSGEKVPDIWQIGN